MIKLIKVSSPDGGAIHFNAVHVAYIRPTEDNVTEIVFANGHSLRVNLRDDELAARITR